MDKMEPEFYTIKETAQIFNVDVSTIYRAIKMKFIIAIKIGNGKKSPYRISRVSIQAIHNSILKDMNDKAQHRGDNGLV